MLRFVEQVTVDPGDMSETDVEALRAVGFDDEDILEITVVAAWYNFVSRLACALGIELETEKQASAVLGGLPWQARVGAGQDGRTLPTRPVTRMSRRRGRPGL